nr:probable inactive ribonuclease-like protein 13 [Loxodonta africana]
MISEVPSSSQEYREGNKGKAGDAGGSGKGQTDLSLPLITLILSAGGMAPAVARLLFLQLVLGSALVLGINLWSAIKNFNHLFIDFPRVEYSSKFQGYCNGIMSYVRGRMQNWDCPKIHYLVHVPFKSIRKYCKHSENFCENYNHYCTLTKDSFPLTICQLSDKQPPTSCYYNTTLTNQKLYLLCSRKYDADPVDIIGLF